MTQVFEIFDKPVMFLRALMCYTSVIMLSALPSNAQVKEESGTKIVVKNTAPKIVHVSTHLVTLHDSTLNPIWTELTIPTCYGSAGLFTCRGFSNFLMVLKKATLGKYFPIGRQSTFWSLFLVLIANNAGSS
jgi:hypothetical protein